MRRLVFVFLALLLVLPTTASAAEPTYNTVHGLRTATAMADELARVGYGGPWDSTSVVSAYARTTAGPVTLVDESVSVPTLSQAVPQEPTDAASASVLPYSAAPGDFFQVVRPNWAWLVVDGRGQTLTTSLIEALDSGAWAHLGLAILSGSVRHLGGGTSVVLLEPAGNYFSHVQVIDGINATWSGNVPNKAFHF